jgi:hypothetical protein
VIWVRPFGQFFDQTALEEAADGSIEAARAEAKRPVRPFKHILHHRIPVPITVRERHENVKRVSMKGDERLRRWGCGAR